MTTTVCTNCEATLVDVYCARCGERQPHHHDLTVGHFAHDVVHELVHLDSKLFRTLRDLVAKPGLLTAESFAGRKTRYIGPLRLFLTLFALQFLAYSVYKPAAMYSVETFTKFDGSGNLAKLVERKAKKYEMTPAQYAERIDHRWHKNLSLLHLTSILGVALFLKLVYRRRYYVEHLVFSAHYLSFSYLFSLALWPIYAMIGFSPGPAHRLLAVVTVAISLVYIFLAQRRFYGDTRAKTVFKTVTQWVGAWFVSVMLLAGSLIAALLQNR